MVFPNNHEDFPDVTTIPEFYKGKTIFITGGTGYLGKLLIEKLLYSCPDIKQIYVFIRNKKGVFPEKRLSAIYNNSCFERLRKERQGLFQSKVTAIAGNILDPNLGLSEEDRVLVTKTTDIVIHSAASVRFDDLLKDAFEINVAATLRLVELAKQMCNLKCFVHVSTSFCNMNYEKAAEEKVYPPRADWRVIKDICYNEDSDNLRTLTSKLLGEYPNTYLFTKHLAEQAVNEQRGKLPIIIVRPSVVTGSLEEPAPGWVDNFNGPVGIAVAGGQGVLRAIYGHKQACQDYVPGDVVTKGILIASWIRGSKTLHKHDDISVYNACVGAENSMSLEYFIAAGAVVAPICAFENTLRPTDIICIKSRTLFQLYVLVTHVLPAIAADWVFRVIGKKPMLLRLQRKVISANLALEQFMTRSWRFSNDNFLNLRSTLHPQDRSQFSFTLDEIKTPQFLISAGLRARKDLLHQDEKSLKKWRNIYKWEVIIDKIVTLIFYVCATWGIVNYVVSRYRSI